MARRHLIEMFGAVDLRLVASGHVHQRRDFTFGHVRHVWSPSAGFIISDAKQEVIGIKETGLVEYRFALTASRSVTCGLPGRRPLNNFNDLRLKNRTSLKHLWCSAC